MIFAFSRSLLILVTLDPRHLRRTLLQIYVTSDRCHSRSTSLQIDVTPDLRPFCFYQASCCFSSSRHSLEHLPCPQERQTSGRPFLNETSHLFRSYGSCYCRRLKAELEQGLSSTRGSLSRSFHWTVCCFSSSCNSSARLLRPAGTEFSIKRLL
jgi:hypothetical protein